MRGDVGWVDGLVHWISCKLVCWVWWMGWVSWMPWVVVVVVVMVVVRITTVEGRQRHR